MIEITITDVITKTRLSWGEFVEFEYGLAWLGEMLLGQSEAIAKLRPNSKILVGGVYEVSAKTSEELPMAEDVELPGGTTEPEDLLDITEMGAREAVTAIKKLPDSADFEVLLELEQTGQNRATVIAALEERL